LVKETLSKRQVIVIDIAQSDQIDSTEYRPDEDPCLVATVKANRDALSTTWLMESCTPVVTSYKLVQIEFKWFGLQSRIEALIISVLTTSFWLALFTE
jgi:hypothetical protein